MILDRYFGRRFLMGFLSVLGMFFLLLVMIDIIEQTRRFRDDAAGFGDVLALTLLNTPQALYMLLPLIMILASIMVFLGLARSSELVIARAAGRSALRTLAAPVAVSLVLGALAVAVMNPIVAATSREYEARAGDISGDATLAVNAQGLWLREGGPEGQVVIRADRANLDGTELSGATFFAFSDSGLPQRRLSADRAQLGAGAWNLDGVKYWDLSGSPNPEAGARSFEHLAIPSNLTADEIRNSFGTPASIPIWELPGFIQRLNAAGFSARRHVVFLHMELALPAFLIAMMLTGAAFTLRPQRSGRTGIMVILAVLLGFAIYFLRNFAQVLAENGEVPAILAAWAPPLAGIGLALALILHFEDG